MLASRLQRLPRRRVCGREVAVAIDFPSRLLGLAGLARAQVGPGLLLPRCASVHTFGMRFELDLFFLDRCQRLLAVRLGMPSCRLAWHPGAAAILEVPAAEGESLRRRPT